MKNYKCINVEEKIFSNFINPKNPSFSATTIFLPFKNSENKTTTGKTTIPLLQKLAKINHKKQNFDEICSNL
jgi:hypothetical protein